MLMSELITWLYKGENLRPLLCEMYLYNRLKHAQKELTFPVHICLWKGKLDIQSIYHTTTRHPIFKTFAFDDATKGFSSKEWKSLGIHLHKFLSEIEKCKAT